MEFNNTPNKSYNVDGKLIWESRSVAVNTVIIAKSKGKKYVLIGERGKGAADYHGYWNVQAGYLDWDESGTEAAKREIFEETNVNINSILLSCKILDNHINEPFGYNTNPSANRQNVSLRFGLYFEVDDINIFDLSNRNSEPDEVGEIKWIPIRDVDKYGFAFNHDELIKNYNYNFCTSKFGKFLKKIGGGILVE